MTHDKLLLGQATAYPQRYAPELLFPIARAEGRAALNIHGPLPFHGVDVWTHYEVSWLEPAGKPRVAMAEIRVPAESPCLIESKSMKLYFNSLNFERFESAEALIATVSADLSAAAQAAVTVSILPHTAGAGPWAELPGVSLDELELACDEFRVNPGLLRAAPDRIVTETLHTHLLRSRCPVTEQPDWGSVMVAYTGPALDRAGLLAYLVSYRNQADFHEQCVERIFMDIHAHCAPQALAVYARYTRRGGLDINPFRSSRAGAEPPPARLPRQ